MEGDEREEQELLRVMEGKKGNLRGAIEESLRNTEEEGKELAHPLPVSEGKDPSAS